MTQKRTAALLAAFLFFLISSTAISGEKSNYPEIMENANEGTDFFFTFIPGFQYDSEIINLKIYVLARKKTTVNVSIAGKAYSNTYIASEEKVLEIDIPHYLGMAYTKKPGEQPLAQTTFKEMAIYVSSEEPITCYAMRKSQNSNEGFLILPVTQLGKQYYISTIEDHSNNTDEWHPSYAAIVGISDNTSVKFTLGNTGSNTADGMSSGQTRNFILNKGDICLISSIGQSSTLAASQILSTMPVAVISGNYCARIPEESTECGFVQNMYFPVDVMDVEFLVPPIDGRKKSSILEVICSEPGAKIFRNNTLVASIPDENSPLTIRASEELNIPSVITADKNITVFQYNTCKDDDGVDSRPFKIQLIPIVYFNNDITFFSPGEEGFSNNYLNLCYRSESEAEIPEDIEISVLENGSYNRAKLKDISPGPGTPFNNAGEKYFYKAISLKENRIYHVQSANPVGAYIYGYDGGRGHNFGLVPSFERLNSTLLLEVPLEKIDFGSNFLGQPKDTTLVFLKNSGFQAVTIDSCVISGIGKNQFEIKKPLGSFELMQQEIKEVELSYTAESLGAIGAELIIYYDNSKSQASIQLAGFGKEILEFLLTEIVFGSVYMGNSRDISATVLKNSSNEVIQIDSCVISGNNKEFFKLNNPIGGFKLSPDEKKNFDITFSPASSGELEADLRIYYSGSTTHKIVRLTGRGKSVYQSLTLTHPNGGEVFSFDEDINIRWEGVEANQPVDLSFSKDAGTSWNKIKEDATGLNYLWTTPPDSVSEECMLKVEGTLSGLGGFEFVNEKKQILTLGNIEDHVISESGKFFFIIGDKRKILYGKNAESYLSVEGESPFDACFNSSEEYLYLAFRGEVQRFNIEEKTFDKTYSNPISLSDRITSIAISANSKYLAFGSEWGLITIYDLQENEIYKQYTAPHAPEQSVQHLRFLPDSERLEFIESDLAFQHIIDIHSGDEIKTFRSIGYIDYSNDGNYYLNYLQEDSEYNNPGNSIIIFDNDFNPIDTIKWINYFEDQKYPWINSKFTNDSKSIIVAFNRQKGARIFCDIKLWDISKRKFSDLGEIDLGRIKTEWRGKRVRMSTDNKNNIYLSNKVHLAMYKMDNLENIFSIPTIYGSTEPQVMDIVNRNNKETILIAYSFSMYCIFYYYNFEDGTSGTFIEDNIPDIYEFKEINGENKILATTGYFDELFVAEIDLETFNFVKTYSDFSLFRNISPFGIAVSDYRNLIAVAYNDTYNSIRIYNKKLDRFTHTILETEGLVHYQHYTKMDFSSDGRYLLFSSGQYRSGEKSQPTSGIYDLETKEMIYIINRPVGTKNQLHFVKYIKNGHRALMSDFSEKYGRPNGLNVINIESLNVEFVLPINSPCYVSKDEKYIVGCKIIFSNPQEYYIVIYDLETGNQLFIREIDKYPHNGLVMNEACTKIVAKTEDGMHYYDIELNDNPITYADDVSDGYFSIIVPNAVPEEMKIESSLIYPNPSSDEIAIPGYEGSVEIYNTLGNKVWSGFLDNGKMLDISGLPNGRYLININGQIKGFIKN